MPQPSRTAPGDSDRSGLFGESVQRQVLPQIVFVLLWRFRMRWPMAAAASAALVFAVYHLFAHYLRVPLPRGFWGG